MAKPKSRVRKKSKNFNFKSPVFIVFLLAIVGLGIFIIFQSFASDGEIGAAKLLVSKQNDKNTTLSDGDFILSPTYNPFSLYDNGLAICGDYPEADKKHNLPYYSKTLTPQERDNFVASIVATGFMDLNISYPAAVLTDVELTNISVDSGNSTTRVYVQDSLQSKPASFERTNGIINSFCDSLTTPYEPQEVVLKSKVLAKEKNIKPNDKLDAEISLPVDEMIATSNFSGSTAKKLYGSHGKGGVKFVGSSKGTVQTVVIPVLPKFKEMQPTNIKLNQSSQNSLDPLVETAHAAPPPVKFYYFRPSDYPYCIEDKFTTQCNNSKYTKVGPLPLDVEGKVNEWYAYKVGAAFNTDHLGKLQGQNTNVWYQSYHPEVKAWLDNPTIVKLPLNTAYIPGTRSDLYIFMNIVYELVVQRGWALDSPRVMEYQGYIYNPTRDWCGISYTSLDPNVIKMGFGGVSIYTLQGRWNYYNGSLLNYNYAVCDESTHYKVYATAAHELGHTQAAQHYGDQSYLMTGQGLLDNMPLTNYKTNDQLSNYVRQSPFIKSIIK